jgi:hypothetical protein
MPSQTCANQVSTKAAPTVYADYIELDQSYYKKGSTMRVTIPLDNPDNAQVNSVTINGVDYVPSRLSTYDTLILEVPAGDIASTVENDQQLKIESINYYNREAMVEEPLTVEPMNYTVLKEKPEVNMERVKSGGDYIEATFEISDPDNAITADGVELAVFPNKTTGKAIPYAKDVTTTITPEGVTTKLGKEYETYTLRVDGLEPNTKYDVYSYASYDRIAFDRYAKQVASDTSVRTKRTSVSVKNQEMTSKTDSITIENMELANQILLEQVTGGEIIVTEAT